MSGFSRDRVGELAHEAYLRGRADFEVDPRRCALMLIDLQEEFVTPELTPFWVPDATQALPRVRRLRDGCREIGVPVLYTAFGGAHGGLDRPRSGAGMPNRFPQVPTDVSWFREGRIVEEVAPAEDELVILKPSYGAFWDTALERILQNLGRDTVLLCGTLTNYCVGATARQAYERGLYAVVVGDCCASDDPELHEAELRVLRKGFARVVESAALLDELGPPNPAA